MQRLFGICIVLVLISCQDKSNTTIFESVFEGGSELHQSVIDQKDKFEIQILFSPIERKDDSIHIEDHFFNYRPGEYFYPASTVKMPVAFMALQKLEELRSAGIAIDRNTWMKIDSIRPPQTPVVMDSTNRENRPTIGHYIDKIFAVSDNDAYNRLYEFCGSDYINAGLRGKGIFTNSRIIHRVGVGGFSYEENKHAPPIHFLDKEENTIFTNSSTFAQGNHLTIVENTQKGVAFITNEGEKENTPFDFSKKNFININDLQESLKRVVFPELFHPEERYKMSENDRLFVVESMAKLPKDHPYLNEMKEEYYDGYVKFFLFGDSKNPIPEHIKIRNKVGFAYGYLTDCAYIQDTKEGIEYFLTATIHVNENQTYNDGVYEYDEVGIPFLAETGRLFHKYMIKNK
ncbi:MAG: serine hydrolase [Saprospiraceae bacterium]|nr:serine hydrolase [Saprospiraceae bacterium]